MTFPTGQTGLIVPVPVIDPVVDPFRLRWDTSRAAGVMAHVTVLYPFMPIADVDADVQARLGAVFSPIDPFVFTLSRVDSFGDDVVWLAPVPDEPFRRMTAAVWEAFPEFPPYEGAHDEPTPHLTVADDPAAEIDRASLGEHLPVTATAAGVELIAFDGGRWSVRSVFSLGS